MNTDLAISIFCFDIIENTPYNKYGLDLVKTLIDSDFNNIHVLTNDPKLFDDFDVNITEYSPEKFSYFDKLTICKEALKSNDQVLYLDCDSRIDLDKLKTLTIKPGLSVNEYWQDGKLKQFKDFNQFNTDYFNTVKDYCLENELHLEDVPLFEERLFTLSNVDNIDEFFNTYYTLKDVFEKNDEKFGHYPVGRAEGLAMGIAAYNSKIPYFEKDPDLQELNLKHLPNN